LPANLKAAVAARAPVLPSHPVILRGARMIHELSGLAMLITVKKSESFYSCEMLDEDFIEQEVYRDR
jgi:hypothetical protein